MPEALHRCVQHVMDKGYDENAAWAICRSSIDMTEEAGPAEFDALIADHEASKKTALAAAAPIDARLIEKNPDGSIVVEVPITVETPVIDLSKTQGGGAKKGSITIDDLRQMESNFDNKRPVTVGFHDTPAAHNRDRSGAQDAFFEAVRLSGRTLWGRIWVSAARAADILLGRWRSFSIEAQQDPENSTTAKAGWDLFGGLWTNRPGSDLNFKIAMADGGTAERRMIATVDFRLAPDKGDAMFERLLTALGAKTEDEAITKLDATSKELAETKQKLSLAETAAKVADEGKKTIEEKLALTEQKAAQALTQIETLSGNLREMRAAQAAEKVKRTIELAIDEMRVDPAELNLGEGKPKWNEQPAEWLVASPYDTADQLEAILGRRAKLKMSGTSSGQKTEKSNGKLQLTERQTQALKDAGLTVEQLENVE